MNSVLQGTTPKLTFNLENATFTVSQITGAELTITSKIYSVTHDLSDMVVDSANNRLSYTFTEDETLNLNKDYATYYQLYVKVGSEIYGTIKTPVNVFQKIKGEAMA